MDGGGLCERLLHFCRLYRPQISLLFPILYERIRKIDSNGLKFDGYSTANKSFYRSTIESGASGWNLRGGLETKFDFVYAALIISR